MQAGPRAKGATLYVTLEPCCHLSNELHRACRQSFNRVRQVVVAMADPNPSVKGRGIVALRRAGITVTTAVDKRKRRS